MMAKKKKKKKSTKKAKPASKDDGSLSLMSLEVANILRLKAVSLKMDGDSLVIEGSNEQGKSSVLRAIEILLAGKEAKTPDEPINGDADTGHIIGTFGDFIVRKTFSRGKPPTLTIKMKDAGTLKAPQTILTNFLSHVSLNPLKFMDMDDREKLATLSDVMGFDSSEYDNEHQRLYDARRDANRDVKRLQAQLDGMECDDAAPKREINVAGLMTRLEKMEEHNRAYAEERARHGELETLRTQYQRRLASLKEEIVNVKECLDATESDLAASDAILEGYSVKDTAKIRQKITDADAINESVRTKARMMEIAEELADAEHDAESINDALEEVAAAREKSRLAAREKLPMPELDITEDAVLYKGKPLSQAGSSAQLRVSVAVAMGLNQDKRIKLLLIDDAEKLDTENTNTVMEMAAEAGFQVLMTRVGTGCEGSVVIEDGTLEYE
jgi:recombinational DNA repair ATPase RecF